MWSVFVQIIGDSRGYIILSDIRMCFIQYDYVLTLNVILCIHYAYYAAAHRRHSSCIVHIGFFFDHCNRQPNDL